MAGRELRVEIIGDSRSLQRALGGATDSTNRFGSSFKKAAKVVGIAAVGMGAAVTAGFVYTLKRGFDELAEGQQVMAQTNAALKSTGQAAGVTAKDVEDLAVAQSKLTGIDDEAVQAGENMLLTFTKVRNEVGKGNDIFNQATVAIEDMATRMNDGAIPSAEQLSKTAIGVGKALNDPIKGMTALAKKGVEFDESQRAAIKTMVESGNTMGAQKLILAELTKEFGGSAKAAGETLPGQLSKLRNSFDEVASQLSVKFLPMLTSLVNWVNEHWPEISAVIGAVGVAVESSFHAIGVAVEWLKQQWEIHRASVTAAWNAVSAAVRSFADYFTTQVLPAIRNVVSALQAIWHDFGGEIKTLLNSILIFYKTWIQNMIAPLKILIAVLKGDWGAAWAEIKATFERTLGAMVKIISGMVGAFVSAAIQIGQGILHGILDGLAGLAGKFAEKMQELWNVIKSAAGIAYGFAKQIGSQIVHGAIDGLTGLASSIKDKVQGALSDALGHIDIPGFSPPERAAAKAIGRPLVEGTLQGLTGMGKQLAAMLGIEVKQAVDYAKQIAIYAQEVGWAVATAAANGLRAQTPSFLQQMREFTKQAVETAKQEVEARKGELASAFANMASAALAAFDAVTAAWKSPARKLLDAMRLQDQVKAVKDAVTDAQNELNRLLAESATASAARQALGTAPPPGMDPEEWQKQVDAAEAVITNNGPAILAAQESLNAALRAQQEFNLEQQAAQEEAAHAAARERQRNHLEQQLANLAQWAERNGNKHRELLERIKKLWAQYGIDAQKWGKVLGEKIAKGLDESADAVAAAAARLGQIIKDNTKTGSPTKAGPLSTFDMRDAGADLVKLYASGMKSALPKVNSVLGDMSVSGGGGGASRTAQPIVVNVYGNVMTENDLVDTIHRGLAMKSKSGYGALFSRTPGVVL